MKKTVILGAGLTGLSVGHHLKGDCEIFERASGIGGCASSPKKAGFTFDKGVHVVHAKGKDEIDSITEQLTGNMTTQEHKAWIYSFGTYTKYPFQANMYGLPPQIIKECLLGYIESTYSADTKKPKHYVDWLYRTFGKGITEHFMLPYTKKMWTCKPEMLALDWVNVRFPRPDVGEIIEGALTEQKKRFGVNATFIYPKNGGIQALSEGYADSIKTIHFEEEAKSIDIAKKMVSFRSGATITYDQLVSTLPLPEIVQMLPDVPVNIQNAANRLKHLSVLCVNIAVDREHISDKHWIYFVDENIPFFRLSFPANFSSSNVPNGKSALTAEITYSDYRPLAEKGDLKKIIEKVIDSLITLGFLKNRKELLFADALNIPYAYVICDNERVKSAQLIKDYLRKHHIWSGGRFGDWAYLWMHQVIMRGKQLAHELDNEQGDAT